MGEGRIFLGFRAVETEFGGGNRANFDCAEALGADFRIADRLEDADLQVCSLSWDPPRSPRRMFIDHGSFADASFWAYKAPRLLASDAILVSSEVCVRVAGRLFAEGEAPRVICVPFAVDCERFQPSEDRAALRRRLRDDCAIPEEGPIVLVASAFVRRKNQHLAVRFLQALLQQVPEARLVIVGGTPDRPASLAYRSAVEGLASDAGLRSRIQILGPLPQARLGELMAASDLLLHLSMCRLENFGLVVAEAMAAGLPVAAADWGGLRDLVVPGETGLLAATYLSDRGPRADWLSVVPRVAALLSDRGIWREMSNHARRRALLHLSREAYRRRLRMAVRTVLDGAPIPPRPAALSSRGEELRFRTISLNATHAEIHDVGDEFRLLMPLDGGTHYRLLAGPAATMEKAPRVRISDRLYPVAAWEPEGGRIRITDPAWPAVLESDTLRFDLLRRCDGSTSLETVLETMGVAQADRPSTMRVAQALVDDGVLCPLAHGGRPSAPPRQAGDTPP